MAIHSSILAWTVPWTEEPSSLQSMRSQSRTRLKGLSIAHINRIKKKTNTGSLKDTEKVFDKIQHSFFWTVVLEKTFESPLDCKEIKPVNPKGNQSWILIGRIDAKAESSILWPPDTKNWLLGKDPDAGKDWRQEEKGTTEVEMVEWHHWLDEYKFE